MAKKLPFTEQFLWDVYSLIEGVSEINDLFARRSTKEYLCSDLYQLRRRYERYRTRKTFGEMVYYLKRKGYLKTSKISHHGDAIILTPKGATKILAISLKNCVLSKRADGKWIMVMFDIPECQKFARETFRRRLQGIGYRQLQRSVWVSPYDVEKETQKIISEQNLQEFTQIFLIKALAQV